MGNKQTLQEHNIDLSSILSAIGSLPIKSDVEEQASVGLYVWKKLTAEGGDFIDYAVSDNESKYPDGGTQDGYWYERVVEGIDLLGLTEYTKIDVLTITPNQNYSSGSQVTVNHGLGEVPNIGLIFKARLPQTTAYQLVAGGMTNNAQYTAWWTGVAADSGTNAAANDETGTKHTNTKLYVTFPYAVVKGETYVIILFA